MNKSSALGALRAANKALGALGVSYWVDCGTLLGLVRDGDFIPWDLDVDLSSWDPERHLEIEQAMIAAGFEMFATHGTPKRGFEQRFLWKGEIKLDIFYFYEGTIRAGEAVADPDRCWQGSYAYSGTKLLVNEFPRAPIVETKTAQFRGLKVPVPSDPEAWLAERYGPDWQEPKQRWDYRTDPPCIVDGAATSLLSDTTVIIKTFMRPHLAQRAVESVRSTYPECSVIVVDDSDAPASLEETLGSMGAELIRLPFDAGLSAGRNAAVRRVETIYTLVMDDDMLVTEETNLSGALELLELADIVCGSLRQEGVIVHWEGRHELTDDGGLILRPLQAASFEEGHGTTYAEVDFGLNGFVARTEFLRTHPWDEELKLGEHTDFFLSIRGDARVLFTPDVVFDHERESSPEYLQMRRRKEFRLRFFAKHGFRYHVGLDGCRDVWTDKDERALARLQGDESAVPRGRSQVNVNDKPFKVKHRTFLDASGRATTDVGRGVRLFAIPGQEITVARAREVGLLGGSSPSSGSQTTATGAVIPAESRRAGATKQRGRRKTKRVG